MSDIKVGMARESAGHFYDRHGNLIESVPYADGRPGKKPTLREARELDLAPGVTTIIREKSAPALEKWKIRQHVLAALTLTRQPEESDEAYLLRVEIDAAEHAKQAAEEGTRIHAAVEQFYCATPYDPAYTAHVAGVAEMLDNRIGSDHPWLAEKSVVGKQGYATKLDLHSQQWLIDWKGKDGDQEEMDRQRTYDSHWMQLAAGRSALGAPNLRCAIGYISRTHPGACSLIEVTRPQIEQGWEMFKAALRMWQARTRYVPSWADKNWKEGN